MGMVALTQSLIASISDRIDNGAYQYDIHPMMARQNRWHASRYGLDASFVDFETMQAVPARVMAQRLIERCEPFAEKLGCLTHLHHLNDIIANGTGAQRQRKVFEQTGDLRDVVKFLVDQSQMATVH
jgi:carboxylate-amine ligase